MTLFRPCIDLHNGNVKQIVGGSLSNDTSTLITNFSSPYPASHYAKMYRDYNLTGGHIIQLGPGNKEATISCLQEWPDVFHVGGGVNDKNATEWIDMGAEKVIVTSFLFPDGCFSEENLRKISEDVGTERLVVDLSCRKRETGYVVAMNKWQTLTDTVLNEETISLFTSYSSALLIHAADIEGMCLGIDTHLISLLSEWTSHPCVYAGGARSLNDLETVERVSKGMMDVTIGSALDIFGGKGVTLKELVGWNKERESFASTSSVINPRLADQTFASGQLISLVFDPENKKDNHAVKITFVNNALSIPAFENGLSFFAIPTLYPSMDGLNRGVEISDGFWTCSRYVDRFAPKCIQSVWYNAFFLFHTVKISKRVKKTGVFHYLKRFWYRIMPKWKWLQRLTYMHDEPLRELYEESPDNEELHAMKKYIDDIDKNGRVWFQRAMDEQIELVKGSAKSEKCMNNDQFTCITATFLFPNSLFNMTKNPFHDAIRVFAVTKKTRSLVGFSTDYVSRALNPLPIKKDTTSSEAVDKNVIDNDTENNSRSQESLLRSQSVSQLEPTSEKSILENLHKKPVAVLEANDYLSIFASHPNLEDINENDLELNVKKSFSDQRKHFQLRYFHRDLFLFELVLEEKQIRQNKYRVFLSFKSPHVTRHYRWSFMEPILQEFIFLHDPYVITKPKYVEIMFLKELRGFETLLSQPSIYDEDLFSDTSCEYHAQRVILLEDAGQLRFLAKICQNRPHTLDRLMVLAGKNRWQEGVNVLLEFENRIDDDAKFLAMCLLNEHCDLLSQSEETSRYYDIVEANERRLRNIFESNNLDFVRRELKLLLDPNTLIRSLEKPMLPLVYAVKNNRRFIAAKLIQYGAMFVEKATGRSILIQAASEGAADCVELILEILDKAPIFSNIGALRIDRQDENGETPLFLGSQRGDLKIVQMLLKRGSSPLVTNKDSFSPLTIAILKNHTDVALALIDKVANNAELNQVYTGTTDHNSDSSEGKSLVSYLSQLSITETISSSLSDFLKHNYERLDWTPLHFAFYQGNLAVIEKLLSRNVLLKRDAKGDFPQDLNPKFSETYKSKLVEYNKNIGNFRFSGKSFIRTDGDAGADSNENTDFFEILDLIISKISRKEREDAISKILSKRQPTENFLNRKIEPHKQTLLHFVALEGLSGIVNLFYDNGADFHIKWKEMTPLDIAMGKRANENHRKTAMELLKYMDPKKYEGADPLFVHAFRLNEMTLFNKFIAEYDSTSKQFIHIVQEAVLTDRVQFIKAIYNINLKIVQIKTNEESVKINYELFASSAASESSGEVFRFLKGFLQQHNRLEGLKTWRDADERTVLMIAAEKGNSNMIEEILEGLFPNDSKRKEEFAQIKQKDGRTAIVLAAQAHKGENVRVLLPFGIDKVVHRQLVASLASSESSPATKVFRTLFDAKMLIQEKYQLAQDLVDLNPRLRLSDRNKEVVERIITTYNFFMKNIQKSRYSIQSQDDFEIAYQQRSGDHLFLRSINDRHDELFRFLFQPAVVGGKRAYEIRASRGEFQVKSMNLAYLKIIHWKNKLQLYTLLLKLRQNHYWHLYWLDVQDSYKNIELQIKSHDAMTGDNEPLCWHASDNADMKIERCDASNPKQRFLFRFYQD